MKVTLLRAVIVAFAVAAFGFMAVKPGSAVAANTNTSNSNTSSGTSGTSSSGGCCGSSST